MKITIKNLQNKLIIHPIKIKRLIFKILKNEKFKKNGHINLCFVNNQLIRKFNTKFHKTKDFTDVLAFNLSNTDDELLADIMISTDMAIKQSITFKTTVGYELHLYVAHGLLHLLGYNDQTKTQTELMRNKEKQYVN
ncbi:MAG: rRNA maturation RNase YbeY [Candidatus Omnitrophota bacterium]